MKRLNITNGSSAIELMQVADIDGDKLSWDDVLHEGPVKSGLTLSQQSQQRCRFISDSGWASPEEAAQKFKTRDESFYRVAEYEEVWLWFEHDLYDQLQLIQILDWFNQLPTITLKLYLINPGKHLGYHSPGEFSQLQSIKKLVTRNQLVLASSAWQAFTATSPDKLSKLIHGNLQVLEFLRAALVRLCEEYPDKITGLPGTEGLILKCLTHSSGPEPQNKPSLTLSALFSAYQQMEAASFMGDSTFFYRLKLMAGGEHPLVDLEGNESINFPANLNQEIRITRHGVAALAGNYDWFFQSGQSKYIGGCQVSPENQWRWNSSLEAFESR